MNLSKKALDEIKSMEEIMARNNLRIKSNESRGVKQIHTRQLRDENKELFKKISELKKGGKIEVKEEEVVEENVKEEPVVEEEEEVVEENVKEEPVVEEEEEEEEEEEVVEENAGEE